jgi:hypothetical protein
MSGVVSAHGYGNVTAITAMARPQTIHDEASCVLFRHGVLDSLGVPVYLPGPCKLGSAAGG